MIGLWYFSSTSYKTRRGALQRYDNMYLTFFGVGKLFSLLRQTAFPNLVESGVRTKKYCVD